MELIKNNRFRTGNVVDIYHTPVYEAYTTSIVSSGIIDDYYTIEVTFDGDLSLQQVLVGDLCAMSFGVGVIDSMSFANEETTLIVQFERSVFPNETVIAKYVGYEVQNTLFFAQTGKVSANFTVANYTEVVQQAVFGYAKVVYNLQTEADLLLTPIRMVDDGTLNRILYSKGYVLKSCNDANYEVTNSWDMDFPIELSGTSIDPIYRRAYLKERKMTARSSKAKATMTFRLIG